MATISPSVGRTLTEYGISGNSSPTVAGTDVAILATANLSNAQTGNGASTNIVDRGGAVGPVALRLTTAIGATPTCTYLVEGSVDGTNWLPIQNAAADTAPQTLVITTFTITTATTVHRFIPANVPVRYIRVTYSANTNVTNTLDAYIY